MPETVRAPSLYLGTTKIAECFGGDCDIKSNSERQYGDQGAFAITDGALEGDITFKTVQPVAGMKKDVLEVLLGQKYVSMGVPYGGKLIKIQGKVTGGKLTWDKQKGTYNGDWTFMGLEPQTA